jgi:DNA-binding LacI/PurR family transcriptional regulator
MAVGRERERGGFRRPTIHDVAALSGVSKSTVSNVLRGAGSTSEATRERVLDAITTLGYRPNAAARNLVQQRTQLIGVVVGDLANAFNADLVKRIERSASEHRYTTLVCNTDGDPQLEKSRIDALLEQRVDGIAMLQFSGDRAVLSQLLADRVPVVMISCWAEYADCVAVDEQGAVALAVEHLVGLGHRRIAHVADPGMEATTRRARRDAFELALLRAGIQPRPVWTLSWDDEEAGARTALGELFAGDDGPTAMVAANDFTAIRLLEELEDLDLRVPRDVSVVGFDGISVGALSRIALTTVAQPCEALAELGLQTLLERIGGGPEADVRQQRLPGELIVRGSTEPPRGGPDAA